MSRIFLFLFTLNTQAVFFDFIDIQDANTAYKNQDYKLSEKKYTNINNDFAHFNKANSLYKQGLYKKSLVEYQALKEPSLMFERLYNIANTQAKLGKINKAIDNYKDALKLKKDVDAEFNLALLKKQKKDNKDNKDNKDKKSTNNKHEKNNAKKEVQKQLNKIQKLEQRRWEKSLKKGVKTLMLPLNQEQYNDNKKNSW